jgi:hypothetical protein
VSKFNKSQGLNDYIQEVLKTLIDHYPDCAYDKLEEVAYLIKSGKHEGSSFKLSDFLRVEDTRNYRDAMTHNLKTKEAQEILQGKKKKKVLVEGEEEEPPAEDVSSILDDQKLFALAGISFGDMDALRLQLSLKKLSKTTSATQVRFFGRIRATASDYFIAEATVEGGDEE